MKLVSLFLCLFALNAFATLEDDSCLVIDDTYIYRRLSTKALQNTFSKIYQAEDGLTAQEMWKRHPSKCILLDWKMPQMDGVEFLKWLRAQEGGDKVWVVFYSTEDKETLPDFTPSASPNTILQKPAFSRILIEAFPHLELKPDTNDQVF